MPGTIHTMLAIMALVSNLPLVLSVPALVSDSSSSGALQLGDLPAYSSVVVFGASYCDNAHPRPSQYSDSLRPMPYYHGRWSNGIIWPEYLAQDLGNISLFDYAYGGAQANNNLTSGTVPDTKTQVTTYLSDVTAGTAHLGQGRVLHVWWIGINPLTQIWTEAIKGGALTGDAAASTHAKTRVQLQVEEVLSQVNKVRSNAQVNKLQSNYLVLPIPPLEIVPTFYYQALSFANGSNATTTSYLNYLGSLSAQYNTGLVTGVGALGPAKHTSGWVRTWDVEGFWKSMKSEPQKYGLDETFEPCLNPSTGATCKAPATYEYWDTLHPTTRVHEIFAKRLVPALTSA